MAKTKAYVRIHSQKTIQVTCGLQNNDVTNPDAHVPDRLKISPIWPSCCVLVKKGSHLYPSEIAEWNTVKALARDKVLTIGEFTDDIEDDVDKTKEELNLNLKSAGIIKDNNKEDKEVKSSTLADIAGE